MFEVMVEIKDAVASATDFAKNLLDSGRSSDIRLEEIDSSTVNGDAVWLVTLSNPAKGLAAFRPLPAIGADASREYRVFTVSKATGDILSMKIRLFAAPQ